MLYLVQAFNLINFLGERQGIYPILSVYNSFLGACTKMRNIFHADQCLDLMERQMVGKNEVTYSELLKVCKLNSVGVCMILVILFSSLSQRPKPHTIIK